MSLSAQPHIPVAAEERVGKHGCAAAEKHLKLGMILAVICITRQNCAVLKQIGYRLLCMPLIGFHALGACLPLENKCGLSVRGNNLKDIRAVDI